MNSQLTLLLAASTPRFLEMLNPLVHSLMKRGVSSDQRWISSDYSLSPYRIAKNLDQNLRSSQAQAALVISPALQFQPDALAEILAEALKRGAGFDSPIGIEMNLSTLDETTKPLVRSFATRLHEKSLARRFPVDNNPLSACSMFIVPIPLLRTLNSDLLSEKLVSHEDYAYRLMNALWSKCTTWIENGTRSIEVRDRFLAGGEALKQGRAFFEERAFAKALPAFDLAVECLPPESSADHFRSLTLAHLQQFKEAFACGVNYLRENPSDYQAEIFVQNLSALTDTTQSTVTMLCTRSTAICDDPKIPLERSIQKLLHKENLHRNRTGVALCDGDTVEKILARLKISLSAVLGQYYTCGIDQMSFGPDFLDRASAYLDANPDKDGIVFDVRLAGADGKERSIDPESCNLNEVSEFTNKNPFWPLACGMFRYETIQSQLKDLSSGKFESIQSFSDELWKLLYGKKALSLANARDCQVLATFEATPSFNDRCDQAVSLMNQKQYKEALAILDDLLLSSEAKSSNLEYLRGVCFAGLNRPVEASLALQRQKRWNPGYSKVDEVLNGLPEKYRTFSQLTFDDIGSAFETIDGAFPDEQGRYLFDLVRKLPNDAVILEVGSAWGRSLSAMVFASLGTHRKIYSLDTFRCGEYDDTIDIYRHNLNRFDLLERVIPIQAASHEVLVNWGNKPRIDFAFIDACHLYEYVRSDYELTFPLVKEGGLIAFHDIISAYTGPSMVWYTQAIHDLDVLGGCGSFKIGRKRSGKKAAQLPVHMQLSKVILNSYSTEYNLESVAAHLLHTLNTSDNLSDELRANAERLFMEIQSSLKSYVRDFTVWWQSSITQRDGAIHYWSALGKQASGDIDGAIDEFYRAFTAEYPIPFEKVRGALAKSLSR